MEGTDIMVVLDFVVWVATMAVQEVVCNVDDTIWLFHLL
jgi:hypothetical protein